MIEPRPADERVAERRFGRLVILLMSIGFLAVLAAGIAAGVTTAFNQERAGWVSHTYEVERQVSGIRLALEEMRSSRRGVLLAMGPGMRGTYDAASTRLRQDIAAVARLTRDNPLQQRRIVEASALADDLDRRMRGSMSDEKSRTASADAVMQGVASRLEHLSRVMLVEEQRLLVQRVASQRLNNQRLFVILAGAGLLVLAVAAGSFWVIRRYTRDLNGSRAQLRLLNENLEGAVQERTRDLQRANDEIQRFAYIVSHDLRSPLVNVMGFTAELEAATGTIATLIDRAEVEAPQIVGDEARAAAREDLPEAIGFIRTSTQKMDRLINAILRLSREGRRTIAPERLDMDAITGSIADTLRHRTDELGVEVRIARPLPAIFSDRLAVEQILSNLVENAVKYLQPGRPGRIEVRGRREGNRVIYEVADNGRGVDPRDHDRIFDLFRRSGVQDQPGEGIGLAHVRAQAYRIGGTIAVESKLGEGATFRINLPVAFTGEQGGIVMNNQRPVNIVMIEDDEGHARLIEKNIRRAGISNQIHHFLDGTSALHFLYEDPEGPAHNGPALILLDLNLPDMSGTDILARIKGDGPLRRAPVVVLTTTDDKQEIQRCYDLGCNVYITKPVNYENFASAIRQLGLFLSVIQVPEIDE